MTDREPPYQHLLAERLAASAGGQIAVVTLNRPAVLNAFNTRLAREIVACFAELTAAADVRAVVVRGAGGRAFCTGADLKERAGLDDAAWAAQHHVFEAMFAAIRDCPAPTIAAVEGFALAGGLELAMCCDIIIAGAGATFGQPEVTRGIIPGGGGTQLLPRLIGRGRAKELIFSGRRIDAAAAERWGLVTRVVEAGGSYPAALGLVEQIAASGPLAVRLAKQAVDLGADAELADGLRIELEQYAACIATEDRYEGIRAFNERRPPRFAGR